MMRTSIELLNQASFKSVLSRPSEGKVALTLLCLVEWADGIQRQCYVKIFAQSQGLGVFNEILGYLLTKAEELPVAPKAGVLVLPEALKKEISIPVAPVAFLTSKINGNSPSSFYNLGQFLQFESLYKVIDGWEKLPQTIAFDEWVANQDRNLGNVIIDSNFAVTLIDHSNMPVDLVWSASMLDKEIEPRNVLSDVFRNAPNLPQKMEIIRGANKQTSSLNMVREEIMFWAERLLNEEQRESLMLFLEHRAKFSNARLSKKYGLLVGVA
ncbi:hypothetical protein [Enterobacter kobei]|uniref:hypothetical protein n=1 Tax=Enterobacter kobei TaxID=208224 RepID=UPI002005517B|nr:hypothetical protein [Enterobacter kobei]MCK6889791.1 hypothetical protein [Enterobacter kobei]